MRFRHADGQTRPPRLLHQRPPRRGRRDDRRPARPLRPARAAAPRRRRARAGAVAARAASPRTLAEDPAATDRLRSELDARGLEVVTLNGFPYRGFQDEVVKHRVYHPDWTEPSRLTYTVDLAEVLARLLPDDAARGSISTLPLAWRHPWAGDRQALRGTSSSTGSPTASHALRERTGRQIRVGVEPEPGCVVETTTELVERMSGWDTDVLGVCLDTCHLAVGFEDAAVAVPRLAAAGRQVVKAQVSAGLHVEHPADEDGPHRAGSLRRGPLPPPDARPRRGRARAGRCAPATTWARRSGATVRSTPRRGGRAAVAGPLPRAPRSRRPRAAPRVDHATTCAPRSACSSAASRALTDHLEVETYTWSVVPEAHRPTTDDDLARSIAGELAWLRDRSSTSDSRSLHDRRRPLHPAAGCAHQGAAPRRRRADPAGCCSTCRACAVSPARGRRRPLEHGAARRHLLRAVDLADRAPRRRARGRRQRVVLPRPRRGPPLAPAQRARRGREGLGTRCAGPTPERRVANVCWWYAMGMDVDSTVTPRPIYHADGRKSPDCYTRPAAAARPADRATRRRSRSSTTGVRRRRSPRRAGSSRPPASCCPSTTSRSSYVPHLDYDLQRFGPDVHAGQGRGRRARRRPDPAARRRGAPRRHASSC